MAKYGISPLAPIIRLLAPVALSILIFAAGILLFLQGFSSNDLYQVVLGLGIIVVSVFFASRIRAPVTGIELSKDGISVHRLFASPEELGAIKKMEVYGTSLIIYYAAGTLVLDVFNFQDWRGMLRDMGKATGIKVENEPQ